MPAELAEALRRLAQAEQGTLFMLLLASFQALLHRYSGQNDIRVGVPIANRNREETEGLIGFFVNTQVLRAELDGQLPFRELLRQVRQAVVEAQGHQDLPFEQLVDALQPERSLSHAPLFQVMYNHQRDDHRGSRFASLGELEVEDLAWDVQTAQFDLTLDTYESSNGLLAELTYATDLFDASSAERIAGHWLNLLQSIVARPEARIAELKLLDEAEARADLLQWNPHPQDFPGLLPAPPDRAPGRRAAAGDGSGLRRTRARLRRIEPAGQSPGAPADRTRCRPRRAGRPGGRAQPGDDRRSAGDPRPAAPMSRSIRATPATGWAT